MFDGRRRVVIEAVSPAIDGGRSPVKRIVGDRVIVEADLLADGHEELAACLLARRSGGAGWSEVALAPSATTPSLRGTREEDRWWGAFDVDAVGTWEYTVCAWVDAWKTWLWAFNRKLAAEHDVNLELRGGADLVGAAAARAEGPDRAALARHEEALRGDGGSATGAARSATLAALMRAYADRSAATIYEPFLSIIVEPVRARFGSWYEMFPRSRAASASPAADDGERDDARLVPHATLREAADRLPYIADLGFDVVYLPPIHPIGRTHRKGRDNSLEARPEDPGSPWAIGAVEGGHTAVHPELGTLEDFRRFVGDARAHGLEVALDIALQASPDHPYVGAHPEWFLHRADGSIQYAENPPKKYEDIYPFAFAGPAWRSLWDELRDVFLFWIEQGVTIFRVDNPHTKPLPFWRWCLASIKAREPRAIFLAEAFTRPKLVRALAKAGFSQSYTYFAWRTTKAEITEYTRSLLAGRSAGILSAELLAEHARHPARAPTTRHAGHLHRARHAGGDAVAELGHLRPGLRAARTRRARRHGGVRAQREVRDPAVEPQRADDARARDPLPQPDPARQPRPPTPRGDSLSRGRQRRARRVQPRDGRRHERVARRREPGPSLSSERLAVARAGRARVGGRCAFSSPRSRGRRAILVERPPRLRRAGSRHDAGPRLSRPSSPPL